MNHHQRVARAKRLCRQACKLFGLRPTAGAIEACRGDPARAIRSYAAVLRSHGRAA